MSTPTLLVNLDTGRSNAALLYVASSLAERLGAQVIGVCARQPTQLDVSGTSYISPDIFNDESAKTEAQVNRAQAEFRHAFQGQAVDWRSSVSFGPPAEYVVAQARHADLLLTGMPVGGTDTTRATAGELIMECGRPVLVVPGAVATPSLDRVLLAWRDTREARRAALDALPLLKRAAHVSVVEVAAAEDLAAARQRVHDVARWLSVHGVAADAKAVESQQGDAEQLRSLAHAVGATLIVAGAYGHSRLREWAFGGVTRTLLEHGDRCALLSH